MSTLRFLGRIDERTIKVEIDLLDMIKKLAGDVPHVDHETGECSYCKSSQPYNNIHTMDCVWAEAKRMINWLEVPVEKQG